jgi:hypothetical protein
VELNDYRIRIRFILFFLFFGEKCKNACLQKLALAIASAQTTCGRKGIFFKPYGLALKLNLLFR